MKTMLAAAIALCDGNGRGSCPGGRGGPPAAITPFNIWSIENGTGRPHTSMPELLRKGRNGDSLNSAPTTPRGFAQQLPAKQGATVQN
jgi:hypothetical protein